MKTYKIFVILILFVILITSQKLLAQTYSTDFDGDGTGGSFTINPSSSGAIIAPSVSTIVNHQNTGSTVVKSNSTYKTTYTPPSTNQMFKEAFVGAVISNLFAPVDTRQQEADALAKKLADEAEAKRIAAIIAEQKRIKAAEDLANFNKLKNLYQSLPGGGNNDLKPLPLPTTANSIDNIGGSSIESIRLGANIDALNLPPVNADDALVESINSYDFSNYDNLESTYNIKLENFAPPPLTTNVNNGVPEIHDNVDKNIEKARSLIVSTTGLLPPALKKYVAPLILVTDVLAVDATVINDCFVRTPPNCPSSGAVAKRIAINLSVDGAALLIGNKVGDKAISIYKNNEKARIGKDFATITLIDGKAYFGETLMSYSQFLGDNYLSNSIESILPGESLNEKIW